MIGADASARLPDEAGLLERDETPTELATTVDGAHRHYELRSEPIGDDREALLLTFQDVSHRTQQRRRIHVLQRVLRHNLRTEMQLVMGHADAIEEAADDRSVAGRAAAISDVASDVVAMSDDIRTLQRYLDGTTDERGPVGARAVARSVADSCRRDWPDATVELRCETDAAVDAGEALEVVLENLIENALVHNDTASPSVEVAVEPGPARPDDRVRISVADDGPGIPDAERRVVTGDDPITPLEHGSGLGLWIVVWLVDAWGGSVEIADAEPRGAVVSCRLRRA